MENLQALRNQIDDIDRELADLLSKRMAVVRQVAQNKSTTDTQVYNPKREDEVIEKVKSYTAFELSGNIASLYRTLMRQSRQYQYKYLVQKGVKNVLLENIERAKACPSIERVVYGGLPGSYSQIATSRMYPEAEQKNVAGFSDVFEAVKSGRAQVGIVPLENTTEGTVNEVYDLLLKYNFYIIKSQLLPIKHCLVADNNAGMENIREVHSHPQALAQCAEFIKCNNLMPVPHINTAVAAKFVADSKRADIAAIASEAAAKQYSLKVLGNNISNSDKNTTRFIAVSDRLFIEKDAGRISLSFTLNHESGTLASTLSIFADLDLSLEKIQSRPIMDKPWEYRFYLDFSGSVWDQNVKSLLMQLSQELPELKFLGAYREESFNL